MHNERNVFILGLALTQGRAPAKHTLEWYSGRREEALCYQQGILYMPDLPFINTPILSYQPTGIWVKQVFGLKISSSPSTHFLII